MENNSARYLLRKFLNSPNNPVWRVIITSNASHRVLFLGYDGSWSCRRPFFCPLPPSHVRAELKLLRGPSYHFYQPSFAFKLVPRGQKPTTTDRDCFTRLERTIEIVPQPRTALRFSQNFALSSIQLEDPLLTVARNSFLGAGPVPRSTVRELQTAHNS